MRAPEAGGELGHSGRPAWLLGGVTISVHDAFSRHDCPVRARQGPNAFQTSADTALTVSMPYCSDEFPFVSTAIM